MGNLNINTLLQLFFPAVHTKCENGYLVACYRPHWEAPYEHLHSRIVRGQSDVHLAATGLSTSDLATCRLHSMAPFDDRVLNFANEAAELWRSVFTGISAQTIHSPPSRVSQDGENITNMHPFCIQVDLVKYAGHACGIRIYKMPVSLCFIDR